MWVEDEFLCHTGVEGLVALGSGVERDHSCVDDLCDGKPVVQDGLHELAVVLQDRCLAGEEAVRLCPPKTETHAEIAMFGSLFVCAGVVGDVEAGDADAASGADNGHEGVENGCRGFRAIR